MTLITLFVVARSGGGDYALRAAVSNLALFFVCTTVILAITAFTLKLYSDSRNQPRHLTRKK